MILVNDGAESAPPLSLRFVRPDVAIMVTSSAVTLAGQSTTARPPICADLRADQKRQPLAGRGLPQHPPAGAAVTRKLRPAASQRDEPG